MPPPLPCSDPAVESVESLQRRLLAIREAFACPICHATLRAPVHLPCGHILCSGCARRHLSIASVCPQPFCKSPATATALTPLRALDVALESVRGRSPPAAQPAGEEGTRLVFLSRKDSRAKARFVERLRANELPTTGSVDVLAARDREFVIRWNANLDAAVPRSRRQVADEVMADERHRERERRKAAHASSAAFFAAKPRTVEDPDVPVEGDDFATLIRKIRARKARLKRERKNGGADNVETTPAEKVRKLGEAVVGAVTTARAAASLGYAAAEENAAADRIREAAVYDVDADTLIIPPSPPSLPPSPCESLPVREGNRELLPAVQDADCMANPERGAGISHSMVLDRKKTKAEPNPVVAPPKRGVAYNTFDGGSPSVVGAKAVPSGSPSKVTRPATVLTQSPANVSTAVSTQPQIDMPGSGGQPRQSPSSATVQFSEEQLCRMERNRQIAIERKKLYFQRLRREQMRQPDF